MRRASFICKPCLWQIRQQILPLCPPSQPCARQWSTLGAGFLSGHSFKDVFQDPYTPDDSRIRKNKREARGNGSRKAASFWAPRKLSSKPKTPDPDEESLDYATIFGANEPIPIKSEALDLPEGEVGGTWEAPEPSPDPGIQDSGPEAKPDPRTQDRLSSNYNGRRRSETPKTIGGRAPKPTMGPSWRRLPRRTMGRRWRGTSWAGYYTVSTIRQLVHIAHNTPPEDLPRAKRRFFAWKEAFHTIRKSLKEDGLASLEVRNVFRDDRNLLKPLLACSKPDEMRRQWRMNDAALRKLAWPRLMLETIRVDPSRAHEVLEATFDENEVPFYAIRDVLNFLVQVYLLLPPATKMEVEVVEGPDVFERRLKAGAHIPRLVLHILRNSTPGFFRFSQEILFAAAATSTTKQLLHLYRETKRCNVRMGFWTKQQYASRFAKHAGYKTIALEILRDLVVNHKLDLSAPHGAALCTSILMFNKKTASDPAHQATRARLFEELLDLGLRPNRITFTAIIRNMCLAKEVDRAWQLFDFMTSSGIEPDDQLYSILINGSKLSGDFDRIATTANWLTDKKLENPFIWNDVIHTIYHAYVQASLESGHTSPKSVSAFPTMLHVYCKYFDPEPLQRVLSMYDRDAFLRDSTESADTDQMAPGYWIPRVAPFVESLQPREPHERLQPDHITLAIMLCGYVKSLETSRDIVIFYATFRQLLKAGDETVARIAAHGTEVHDAVLLAITRWPGMLRVALDILNDMLDSHTTGPLANSQREPGSPDPIPHPKPSAHTWAALIKGLGLARQPDRAEQALRVMDGQGDTPDDTHWNTVTAGYARGQDVEGVISALRRRVAAGFPPDEYTIKAFGYLRSPGDAYEQMEEMVEARDRALAREEAERNEVLGLEEALEGGLETLDGEHGEGGEGGILDDDDVSSAEDASGRSPLQGGMSPDERGA
jgi:pentatricopeptide repeat protein